ncbi:MAG: 5'-nucleotidase C-terminal domain-containing protein [Pseudomonadota bacterium]
MASLNLRLIATSDLHATLWPYDYLANRPMPGRGLAVLASTITQLRRENPNTLLLDNGDTLEGTPLADIAASDADNVNPMIEAMNAAGYDAAVPGNHDFNYGLDTLCLAIEAADFPYVLSNIRCANGEPLLPASLVLERELIDTSGSPHMLRIGIVGLAPPQIVFWEKSHLRDSLVSEAVVPAATRELQRLQSDENVDVTIALCHGGIDFNAPEDGGENAVVPLAATGHVDAIIAGHTHDRFPRLDFSAQALVDPTAGTVKGVPVVQPGAFGGEVGVIDLELQPDSAGKWRPNVSASRLVQGGQSVPDAAILARTKTAHDRALAQMTAHVGLTQRRLVGYFDLFAGCCVLSIVSSAQLLCARQVLSEAGLGDAPLLSSVAPLRAGGSDGQSPYTDIPIGPLEQRHMFDIYPYANRLVVKKITGAGLRAWLEQASHSFLPIVPGLPGQKLLDLRVAGYAFDVIEGVTYEIDVTAPKNMPRIRNLCYQDVPVTDDAAFYIVTNSYRAGGGSGYLAARDAETVLNTDLFIRDVVADYIRDAGEVVPAPLSNWRFAAAGGTPVIAETGMGAAASLKQATNLGLRYIGVAGGVAQFEVKI